MERIFIPTVNRPSTQITLAGLPADLRKRTTLVVQSWERDKYNYDCNYLVLPEEINLSDRLCLAKTRAYIYAEARNEKYAVLDDDLVFMRRNSKRFTGVSNMEKSSRIANDEDIREMFSILFRWLNEPTVTVCGPSQVQNIPANTAFRNNTSLSSAIWINGKDFTDVLDDLPLTEVRYGEDALFLLSLLTRGYGNRSSQEFCYDNKSLRGKLAEGVWRDAAHEDVLKDHRRISEIFPNYFKVEFDQSGQRVAGGFRNFGKVRTFWSQAYKSSSSANISSETGNKKQHNDLNTLQSKSGATYLTPTDFLIPGDNQVTISDKLASELKDHFSADRTNRFKLYVLSSGIRSKYLDNQTQKYLPEFTKWYDKTDMKGLFGSIANFTKYASAGDVVNYVATKTSSAEKYLNQIPVSVGALYELSMVLKSNEEAFKLCLQFTASRKSVDEPKFDWKTKKPALIAPSVTEQAIRAWRQKWENPPPPKVKRTDKRTLPLLTIYCSGELLDFDRKTGEKTGCLDLDQVEAIMRLISENFTDANDKQFRLESKMAELTSMYFKRKEYYDVARNVTKGKKDTSGRYV